MVVPMVKCSISCCVLWILLLLLVTAAAVLAITAGILHSSLTSAQVRLQHFDLIEMRSLMARKYSQIYKYSSDKRLCLQ